MPPFKIVITDFGDPSHELEEAELRASGLDYQLLRLNTRLPEELIPHVADADALIVQWATISRPVIESLKHCRVISRYGIGVDMVDLEAASECGIPVSNVPDYCIDEVSTHTIAFVLALNRRLVPQSAHVGAGKWGGAPGGMPARLNQQSLGVLGLGRIGREVARKAQGLGLKVLAFDPYLPAEQAKVLGVELLLLEELLRRADYVTVHCPLTKETRHLIGAAQLALMKPTAFLINMARGPVVDQSALYEALVNGVIAGAAADVLEQEPPDPNDPLLKLPNILVTPHSSSASVESVVQLRREVARNVVLVLQGHPPRAVVNPQSLRNSASRAH
jgi:D-3-phosphoglycerate dehydrogenase / 2-oxoglutarate reductase